MATYIEPFDLKTIFVNYFLGNQQLFPFGLVIVMGLLGGYFGMSNMVFLIILTFMEDMQLFQLVFLVFYHKIGELQI